MTTDDLDRLLAAATPGPWESHSTICCPDRGWVTGQETGHTQPTHAFSVADAEMVATLRNLAPALLRLWRAASAVQAEGGHYAYCSSVVGEKACDCGYVDLMQAMSELENHR